MEELIQAKAEAIRSEVEHNYKRAMAIVYYLIILSKNYKH